MNNLMTQHAAYVRHWKLFLSRRFAFTCLITLSAMACAADARERSLEGWQNLEGIPIYAAGDIADCRYARPEESGAAATAALLEAGLAQHNEAVVLNLGDSTYPDGHPLEFSRCYHPTWGRFKDRTYPVPGNHEYRTRAASGHFSYFGAVSMPQRGGYYSFRIGDWHVIALNSNLRGKEFAAQMDWLTSDLRQNQARCTLAYWHHPVFSSGEHGDVDAMLPAWRILADANAELVLAAHDHHYERFAPMNRSGRRDEKQGIRQFIVGTGGARLRMVRIPRENSEANSNVSHGVLKLVLKSGAYAWQFLPVSGDARADQGSGTCH
jgi:hypothetical protein